MVSSVQLVAALIGVSVSAFIFYLVRKDHLVTKDGLIWLLLSLFILLLSLFTDIVDKIGLSLGISYPPILLVLVGIAGILIKLVLNDVEKTQIKADVERLLQHNALLEAEVAALRKVKEHATDTSPSIADNVDLRG
ncbi:DUF2304 domain-containing protein [Rheinheimera sp.]|uniref:DUF2304 domain-containing protein n=1 Tax=Rheinheimera sp. TaxID=1869214 RepID=UPI00307EB100